METGTAFLVVFFFIILISGISVGVYFSLKGKSGESAAATTPAAPTANTTTTDSNPPAAPSPSPAASPAASSTTTQGAPYADGTVIRDNSDGGIYQVIDGQKLHFSPAAYSAFGSPAWDFGITKEQAAAIPTGPEIDYAGRNFKDKSGNCLGAGNWGDDTVYLWGCDPNINKLWVSAPDNQQGFFKNVQRQHCLTSNGLNNRVTTKKCDANNSKQQWKYDGNYIFNGDAGVLDSNLNLTTLTWNENQRWNN